MIPISCMAWLQGTQTSQTWRVGVGTKQTGKSVLGTVELEANSSEKWGSEVGVGHCITGLRVEFLLKTDSGYPKDTGVNKPW